MRRLVPLTATVALGCVAGSVSALASPGLPRWLAAVSVIVIVVFWLGHLDGWRRLYAITLFFLISATSSVAILADIAFYGRYVLIAILVWWTWHVHRDEHVVIGKQPFAIRSLVYGLHAIAGLAAASTVWSADPWVTAQQAVAMGMLASLIHLLVARRWVTRERIAADLRVAYLVLAAATAASVVAGVVGMSGTRAYNGRLQGIFSNPNTLGIAAALTVPLAWGIYRETGRARYLLGLAPALVAVYLSGSRTALVAIVVAGLWLLVRYAMQPRFTVPAVGLFCFSVFGLLFLQSADSGAGLGILARFSGQKGADILNSRPLAWSEAITLWREQPLVGWGFQAGETLFARRQGDTGFSFTRTSVHNSYLQMLLELGAVGFIVLAALICLIVVAISRAPAKGSSVGAIGVLVVGLAVHMTESAVFGTGQVYPFVFWLAATVAVLAYSDARQSRTRSERRTALSATGSGVNIPNVRPRISSRRADSPIGVGRTSGVVARSHHRVSKR